MIIKKRGIKTVGMKEIKEYIMNEASEQDMVNIVEFMRAKKASMDLDKIAQEKQKILDKVQKL